MWSALSRRSRSSWSRRRSPDGSRPPAVFSERRIITAPWQTPFALALPAPDLRRVFTCTFAPRLRRAHRCCRRYFALAADREAFARENSVAAFDSFEALCDAADVLDLCSPPSTHETLPSKPSGAASTSSSRSRSRASSARALRASGAILRRRSLCSAMPSRAAAALSKPPTPAAKTICYAENWVYAPAIQKSARLLQKRAQILWMMGISRTADRIRPITGSGAFPAVDRWWAKVAIHSARRSI